MRVLLDPDSWDGVVDIQMRDVTHKGCYGRGCSENCRPAWFGVNDTHGSGRPPLPFFAWHPTFCDGANPCRCDDYETDGVANARDDHD